MRQPSEGMQMDSLFRPQPIHLNISLIDLNVALFRENVHSAYPSGKVREIFKLENNFEVREVLEFLKESLKYGKKK